MPFLFQELARISFTTQQQPVPKPWTAFFGETDGVDKCDIYALKKLVDIDLHG